MMHGFEFYTPTRVIFGAGSLEKLPEAVGRCGAKRVFVIYGGQSAKKSGTLDRVEALLTGAGIAFAAIGGVKPNPRLGLAREAIREAIAFGADLILAVGGGSVIDTAKATAHGTANPEADIWDIWMGKVKLEKSLPVGVVLTIPAAGSEMSDSAVLTDEAALAKRGLNTDLNRPAFALMDPALAATLPARQAACGVTDIMMHTLERYVNPLENDMTDEIAEALLRVVIRHGEAVVKNPSNIDAMSESISDLEDAVYDEDEDDDECDDDCCCCGDDDDEEEEDPDYFEFTCPDCGEKLYLDEEVLEQGSIKCKACGREIQFEIVDECGCEDCCGCEDGEEEHEEHDGCCCGCKDEDKE